MEQLRYIKIPQLYFKAMWIFTLLLYILIPLESRITNLIYKGIVLITFGCLLLVLTVAIRDKKPLFDDRAIIYLVLLVVAIVVSLLLGDGRIGFNTQIMGIMGFLEMPIAIILLDRVHYNKRNVKFVFGINLCIAIVFSMLSFSEYAYSGKLDSLYLGYSNPNATAIYLLLNQVILLLYLPQLQGFLSKVLVLGLCAYEEYLILLTDSRTCLAVSIVILLYYLLGRNLKLPKWLVAVAFLFPLAFLFLYTALYRSGRFSDLSILDKEFFSGREEYFIDEIRMLANYPAFGDVRQHYFTNMHNGPLAIMASCGITGYVLHLFYYFRTVKLYYRGANSRLQRTAMIVILGIFLYSSAEAALMVGGAHYSIIVATFFWTLKGKTYEENS